MNVNELLALLEQMADAGLGEREVLFTSQANYPLQDHIAGGWVWEPDNESHDDDDGDEVDDSVVYLVSGGQVYDKPYGPGRAFNEATKSL